MVNDPFKYLFVSGCSMDHGFCTNDGSITDECICHPGWKGENCTECIAYPGCPEGGTCNEPWECQCPLGVVGSACGIERKHNTLPKYYHHQMSITCSNVNRFLSERSERNGGESA
jgi:hypothetical protein